MKLLCQVYRSSRQEEMYLYVCKANGLSDVPASLLERFGEPVEVMTLLLGPERKLARAEASDVLQSIAERGFYLQMPPTAAELQQRNSVGE
jgi:uncharacterized protein YcgL (UPF0745 family)